MTTAVMTPDDPHGHSAPLRPIVLALNCDTASRYLHAENEVLTCLLGVAILRIDVKIARNTTSSEAASADILELLKVFPDETYRNMDIKAHDPAWLGKQVRVQVLDGIKDHILGKLYTPEAVKAVLIDAALLEGENNVLYDILTELYPDAGFFRVGTGTSRQPHRIWRAAPPYDLTRETRVVDGIRCPVCTNCSNVMRPAGTAFVCESCGEVMSMRMGNE